MKQAPCDGQMVEETIDACRQIVQQRRYAAHPFVAHLDRVQPERAGLRSWAVQKYHQVFRQNVIYSSIHANGQQDEEVRRHAMDQLLAEETGLVSGDAPHYQLMRRFAESCGAGPGDFEPGVCSRAVQDYVGRLVRLCQQRDVAIPLLVIYAIESQSGEAAGRLGEWLSEQRGFTPWELAWFTVHAEDEDDHAAEGLRLVRRLAPSTPDLARRAISAVEEITAAWLRLHDHYLGLLESR